MTTEEWEHLAQIAHLQCNTPYKKKYATKELAEEHINRAIKKDPSLKDSLKVYKCESCIVFFHLTSH